MVLVFDFGREAADKCNGVFEGFSGMVEMLSPNGVYHLLLEMRVGDYINRTISPIWVFTSAIGWTILPLWAYIRRFQKMDA